MIAAIHQLDYLPWLGFFHKASLADVFVALDDVQFEKNSFTNRNKIKTSGGWAWMTVPVLSDRHFKERRIKDCRIDATKGWRKKHQLSLMMNYAKSEHFGKYMPFFEGMYSREWESLAELNFFALKWLFGELGIKAKLIRASEIGGDFGKKSDLVLNICKELGADAYVSGTLGKDYLDVESFRKNGIEVVYQEYEHPEYGQLWGPFEPCMSVVDLIFNRGPESLDIIKSGNVTKDDIYRRKGDAK